MPRFLSLCLALSVIPFVTSAEPDPTPVKAWVDSQRDIKSLSALFVQDRYLSRVKNPIRTEGSFLFKQSGKFRWELGKPAKTIAVADGGDSLYILKPGDKDGKKYTMDDVKEGRAPAAAGFLSGGVPREWEELDRHFKLKEVSTLPDGTLQSVEFSLRDAKAATHVLGVRFDVDPATKLLKSVVIRMRDGSRYETTFYHCQTGVSLPDATFRENLEGYTIESMSE
jgi:outer membrane lipoprotein-sorting protein